MKFYILALGLIKFIPVSDNAAGKAAGGEHSSNMQHCMPDMKAHCQEIADLEYMEKRMKLMRTCMQYCAVDANDCRMPAMTGKRRKTAIDGRTTRHRDYAMRQIFRKPIEEIFGLTKSSAGKAKTRLRGTRSKAASITPGLTAYNLIRLPKLLAAPA